MTPTKDQTTTPSGDDQPIDPANGRFLCTPDRPMPRGAPGLWAHTSTVSDGECYEGCCDDYKCTDCGATWRVEHC